MTVSWDIAPCSLAEIDRCFRGAYCQHLMFVTVFTIARYLSLSWEQWTQPTSSEPIYLRYILILSSHPLLGLPSWCSYMSTEFSKRMTQCVVFQILYMTLCLVQQWMKCNVIRYPGVSQGLACKTILTVVTALMRSLMGQPLQGDKVWSYNSLCWH
jgi:hypothetical protein